MFFTHQYLLFLLTSLPIVLSAPTVSSILAAVGAGFTAAANSLNNQTTTATAALATTQNALVDNQTCGAMNVVFARGTTEPGNVSIGRQTFSVTKTYIS